MATTKDVPAHLLRLTAMAHGGGCACKISPGQLERMVAGLTGHPSPNLVVGIDDGDDAAVVRLSGDPAVISTADFFTPVVDDAYDWGRIAAANALSDVYAMGGAPIVALVSVNFVGHLPLPLGVAGHEGSTVVVGLNGLRLLSRRAWTTPA